MSTKRNQRMNNWWREVLAEAIEPRLLLSTYTVNTISDSANPGVGLLTLRQAVANANTHAGADTIAFSSTVFAPGTPHTITLTHGEITFTDTSGVTTVNGPGSSVLVVSGGGASRVFRINSGVSVAISGLGVVDGEAGALVFGGNIYGGGIYNAGILTLTNSIVSNNTATASVGTFVNSSGGGIYSPGSLILLDDTIRDNAAKAGSAAGGAGAGNVNGGGLFAGGSLVISDSAITNNSALAGTSSEDLGMAGGANGGGIYAGEGIRISNSIVSNNTAEAAGVFMADPSAGGGIYAAGSAIITQDTIDDNILVGGRSNSSSVPSAAGGGVDAGGILMLQQSTISGNTVNSSYPEYGLYGGTSAGGGVDANDGGTIVASTISNNSATGGQGYNNALNSDLLQQGGKASGGGVSSVGTLTITNSILYGNSAIGGVGGSDEHKHANAKGGNSFGGAIEAFELNLLDSTVTGNSTIGGAGGVASPGSPPGNAGSASGGGIAAVLATFTNSIVSADKAGGVFSDFANTVNSISANNLIGIGSGLTNGVNGNLVDINNPHLSPIGNNGGPIHTLVPLPGSPAIDAGNSSFIPSGITTDQRGLPRIVGKAVDIGATEFQASIFGAVFNDINGNGKQDSSELGIPGVTVFIDATNTGVFKSGDRVTTTNSSGNYSFTGLVAGTYIVRQMLPTGDKQTFPTSGFGNHVTITTGQTATGVNFGDQKIAVASISGMVFNDANGNQKQIMPKPESPAGRSTST